MKIVILDGGTTNPGDVSWAPLTAIGEVTAYDSTPAELVIERAKDAEAVIMNRIVMSRAVMDALPKLRYIGALCEKTRQLDDVLLGVSPRAALALMRVSQACAAMDGRDYVTPEDIKRMAIPALAHRMILRTAYGQRSRAAEAVQQALDAVPVPTEKTDR